jgi:hypothetical protein
MKMLTKLSFLTIIATALPSAREALAQDQKVVPGAVCNPRFGTSTNYDHEPDGSIANTSTTASLLVDCSIVRDGTLSTSPVLSGASVWVVNPGPASGSVSCVLLAEDDNSAAFAAQTRSSTFIANTPQQLAFGALNGGALWALHVRCGLPPASPPVGPSKLKNVLSVEP